MLINIVIGAAIFGYAGWTIYKYVNKSRQGKCAACSVKNSCNTKCEPLEK